VAPARRNPPEEAPMSERRSMRKQVSEALAVTDCMGGGSLGRIGNLSAEGLMLISPRPVYERHVYQIRFPLPGVGASAPQLEAGIQCLWAEAASGDGAHWAGCQIVSISPEHQDLLEAWLESINGH